MHGETPALTLTHKGGENIECGQPVAPSPSMGEGWGGGDSRFNGGWF
jgi:hypothetical protein